MAQFITFKTFGIFNQPINNLQGKPCTNCKQVCTCCPSNIESIYFGSQFNQPVNNLPPNLKKLKIGRDFCQSLKNLPSSIEHIELYNNYNNTIDNLPTNIKYLTLNKKYPYLDMLKKIYPDLLLILK